MILNGVETQRLRTVALEILFPYYFKSILISQALTFPWKPLHSPGYSVCL